MSIDQLIRSALADQKAGRLSQAAEKYRQVLSIEPANFHALHFLGIVSSQMDQSQPAIDLIHRSLAINPNQPDAWSNLSLILARLNQLDQAINACHKAISLRPNYVNAHNNLGNLLRDLGQLDQALTAYRKAQQLEPQNPTPHSSILFTLNFSPGQSPQSILEEARRWNQLHSLPLAQHAHPHPNNPAPDRRLSIGYVSPDFRDHVVGRNLLPLLAHHDRSQFHITCYSGVNHPDEFTERFHPFADIWRSTIGLSDRQLAQLIRADRIDILLDLSLHMANNRLQTFSLKPVPIQITFAGYPGTTGLTAIDYRLTDPRLDPPEHDPFYSEKSIRLPHSFWCYDPIDSSLPVSALPAASTGQITFGCLNNFCKINDQVLALWARVLQQIPDARMIILAPPGDHRLRLTDRLAVDSGRLKFIEYQSRPDYLQTYHRIDISLDTFPYNGHTTSLDALWMGVPVVTLPGQTAVSRAGLSQLTNLNLTELIAANSDQFIQIAVDLASNLPRLIQLRATLRQRMELSPLMNAPSFTRGIEDTYRTIWKKWCEQQPRP